MAQHPPMDVKTTVTGDAEARKALVRRFARLVSLAMIDSLQRDRSGRVMGQRDQPR